MIAYSNHHYFHDGHLAWLLLDAHLHRPTTIWMADWDRLPFFAAVDAQPFPPNDAARRTATLLRTARRFQQSPRTVLVYYPEGTLHPPEDGIQAFDRDVPKRLSKLYSKATWWPYAVHLTWEDEPRPTALLTGGSAHEVDGRERGRLQHLRQQLQQSGDRRFHVLLDGNESKAMRWDFSFARAFFERYL